MATGFFNINPDRMKDLAANAENINKGGGGSDVVWLKFNAGKHTLRILPPWSEEGITVRTYQRHKGPFGNPYATADGFNVQPLCYKWLLEAKNESFRNYLLSKGKIKEDDLAQAKEFGCPLCWLPIHIMKQDIDKKEKKKQASSYWATTRHLFNFVVVDGPGPIAKGTVAVGDMSNKFYKAILVNSEMYEDMYSVTKGNNIVLIANYEGKDRRYESPVVNPKASKVGVKPDQLYNLDELAAKAARGFDELVAIAAGNHSNFPEAWRLGPKAQEEPSFGGITDDDIPF
jgi:hypothetical protein